MFLPPENREPPLPFIPSPPKRVLSAREERAVIWIVGLVLVLMFLAPIGGSTVLEALWYLVTR